MCVVAVTVAGVLQLLAKPESAAYQSVAMTRYYWFLSQWRWYELVGLAAPLTILAVIAFGNRGFSRERGDDSARAALARTMLIAGITAVAVATIFGRGGLAAHPVARLQPLRIFQLVYVVMILVVGAALAEWVLRRSALRWFMVFSVLAVVMVVAERQTFSHSTHMELSPWARVESPW